MKIEGFRRGVEMVGRFLTGKLVPERLTPEDREKILGELASKKTLARRGIMASPLLNPDKGAPQVNSMTDLLVVRGHLPFSAASNILLRDMYGLTRAAERSEKRQVQSA